MIGTTSVHVRMDKGIRDRAAGVLEAEGVLCQRQ
jgi:hypothetical protein